MINGTRQGLFQHLLCLAVFSGILAGRVLFGTSAHTGLLLMFFQTLQFLPYQAQFFENGLLPFAFLLFALFQEDAPSCDNCGAITVRAGNCYLCHNCGASMGCS